MRVPSANAAGMSVSVLKEYCVVSGGCVCVDVVAPFQFTTQIRAVNPSGIIVGHIMDFTVAGDEHHILNFGTGVLVAERILEGFHLLGVFQIDLSQKLVNRLAILPGETTAATQTLRRRNFFFLRRPRCLTALAPAKACHAGAGAVGPAPCCPRKPRLNLRGRCLLLWRSGVSLARLHGERCTPDLFAGIKKKSTILPTKYSAFLVENIGIEPLTSCMPCKRSPS